MFFTAPARLRYTEVTSQPSSTERRDLHLDAAIASAKLITVRGVKSTFDCELLFFPPDCFILMAYMSVGGRRQKQHCLQMFSLTLCSLSVTSPLTSPYFPPPRDVSSCILFIFLLNQTIFVNSREREFFKPNKKVSRDTQMTMFCGFPSVNKSEDSAAG